MIASKERNIRITIEKVWLERKNVPLISTSSEKISRESLQQGSADASQTETHNWYIKGALHKILAERRLNITIILNNFKSFIKKVFPKGCIHKCNKKRLKIITSEQKRATVTKNYLDWKKKSRFTFNNRQKIIVFIKFEFYQIKFANLCCFKRNWQLFLILLLWSYSKWKVYYIPWMYMEPLQNNVSYFMAEPEMEYLFRKYCFGNI